MKYLIESLVIPSAHLLFMLAFTICALSIGVTALPAKLKPKKISK